jgi:hypothetical protein
MIFLTLYHFIEKGTHFQSRLCRESVKLVSKGSTPRPEETGGRSPGRPANPPSTLNPRRKSPLLFSLGNHASVEENLPSTLIDLEDDVLTVG